MESINKSRTNTFLQTGLLVGLLLIVLVLSNQLYLRLDLTEDSRFTLGEPSKELLKEIERPVFVTVYLAGDLPSGFERLREAVQDMLDEFRYYSDVAIEYEFVDPYEIATGKARSDLFIQLKGKGLKSFELENMKDDEIVRKVVWPSALVKMGEEEVAVSFLKDQMGMDPQVVLHNSEMGVEYELAKAIHKLRHPKEKRIAFIDGHGELPGIELADIGQELALHYKVDRLSLPRYKPGKLEQFDLVVIAKPDSDFTVVDQYKLDQYVMNGGSVLWIQESLRADMDSLRTQASFLTMPYELNNLNNLLFKYGVRINTDLVQDYNCHRIPIMAGNTSNQANFRQWPYYPLLAPRSEHPIVRDLGLLWTQFPNPIDTVAVPGIKKTILLQSSDNSRLLRHPHQVSLNMARINLDPAIFNKGPQNLSVLLEGNFTSAFKNRLTPKTLNNPEYGAFKEEGQAKIIVVSDAALIANQVNQLNGSVYALGFDRFTQQTFGNKSFILNCVDYLIDDSGLFQLRSKDYKLRLLERGKSKTEALFWQLLNLVAPLVLVVVFGFTYIFIRRRKFARQ